MVRTGFVFLALLVLCFLAACGPKDKRVVFVSERGGDPMVYTMNSDGSDASGVPSGGDEGYAPSWSPTRNHVALLSQDDDESRLVILAQDGDDWDSCTIDEDRVLAYSWDPKGQRVAFLAGIPAKDNASNADEADAPDDSDSPDADDPDASEDGDSPDADEEDAPADDDSSDAENENAPDKEDSSANDAVSDPLEGKIFVADADCANVTPLTSIGGAMILGNWSPDSQWVVYSIVSGDDQGVFLRNPTGVDRREIDDEPATYLAFTPKGDSLAFMTHKDGDEDARISIVRDIHQPAPESLTNRAAPNSTFAWSPDGKRIVYVSNRDGDPEIYIISDKGSDEQQLTSNEFADTLPSWSSNGKRIIFVSDLFGNKEIFVMDEDGSNQQRLTNNDYNDTQPRW